MGPSKRRGALITTDPGVREALGATLQERSHPVEVVLDLDAPFTGIGEDQLKALRRADPELVFLDVGDDPTIGIRFAQFLAEANPARRMIATGPTLSPELLMSAMRAGVSEYIPKPIDGEELSGAIERVLRKLGGPAAAQPRQPGKVYTFFGAKGGSGSTTIATNLAIRLHQLTGRKTLLVDLDLELGETALLLGVDPRFTLLDLIRNFHRLDAELLSSFIERHDAGVHLLAAPVQPDRTAAVTADQIRRLLPLLRQHYDYVIVDTPKSFSAHAVAALEQADLVFLVTLVNLAALRNLKRCRPLLERVLGGEEKLRLLVNRYQRTDIIELNDVERALELSVFWTLSNDYEAVVRSIDTGRPIVLNGSSAYARDLSALAAEIAGVEGEGGRRRGGLLGALSAPFQQIGRRRSRREEVAANE